MAWIATIEEDAAGGDLAAVYEAVRGARGRVANVYKVHSLLPETMRTHMDFYLALLYGRCPLTRPQREMIAVVVSALNGCRYCVVHHSEALQAHLKDADLVAQVAEDYREAELGARERGILDYAAKLTRRPDAVTEADVEALRHVGLDDAGILAVNLIASYFNFVNRVVSGLGVPLEPEAERSYRY